MKIRMVVMTIGILALGSWGWGQAQESKVLKDQKEKVSYVIGVDIGKALQKQGMEIQADLVAKGIKDGLAGGKFLMSEQEIQETMMAFQKEMRAKQEESKKQLAETNKKEGEAFLAQNKTKEGVTTLPSGLQYKVVKAGTGKKPKATDTVVTHYKGTLLNGTEFDSSYKRNQPATFKVNAVIRGWTEALQLMEEGAKWILYVPAALAYGERGAGAQIGPNATLIFEVELVSIQEPK
jgi:FKBP-type peptidyl-prolyl cis-trans isomerase